MKITDYSLFKYIILIIIIFGNSEVKLTYLWSHWNVTGIDCLHDYMFDLNIQQQNEE